MIKFDIILKSEYKLLSIIVNKFSENKILFFFVKLSFIKFFFSLFKSLFMYNKSCNLIILKLDSFYLYLSIKITKHSLFLRDKITNNLIYNLIFL